ncbi:MAG: protein kinase [Planctomycetota bacterium]
MSGLERYRLEDLLGQGGMGAVYRARDLQSLEPVAVKLLHLPSQRARERMLREIRALAALDHRGIVRVRDAGAHEGSPFVVLDFVQGETLTDRVNREGPCTSFVAAELARDLAEALDHAHARGVVHRDVKPDNVLVDAGGAPRLTDFGLSTQTHEEQERLTQSGALLGTPGFLAPEQAEGRRDAIGPLSDVYGVGGVLYFALTGRPPITGTSLHEVVAATCHKKPQPPQELNPEVDPRLAKVCLRCLEKAPEARYPSAEALAQALDEVLTTPRRAVGGGWLWLGLGLAGGLAVGGGVVLGTLNSGPTPPPSVSAPQPVAASPDPDDRGETPEFLALCTQAQERGNAGHPAEALELALRAAELAPRSARGWFTCGVACMALKDLVAARGYFERARDLEPERSSVRLNLGVCYASSGELEIALEELDLAIALKDDAIARVQRSLVYRDQGNRTAALADLAQVLELHPAPSELINGAHAAEDLREVELQRRFLVALAEAVGLAPHERLERARLVLPLRPEVALADADAYLLQDPDSTQARFQRARALAELARWEEAWEAVKRVPYDCPESLRARELEVTTAYYLARYEDAVAAWQTLAPLGRAVTVGRTFACLCLIELGRVDEAQALVARELERDTALAVQLRAALAFARGDLDTTRNALVASAQYGSEAPDWFVGVHARALDQVGRPEALAIYRTLLTAKFLNPDLKRLARLRVAALEAQTPLEDAPPDAGGR